MKLRIKGDSLRLRLTKGEVSQLAESGMVEERVRFGAGADLVYRLHRDAATRDISASFAGGVVDVRVPDKSARDWAGSNEVTLAGNQSLGSSDELRIVIEKDFACLAPREGEDESDHFANPTVGKVC
jgi:hypothetical protein